MVRPLLPGGYLAERSTHRRWYSALLAVALLLVWVVPAEARKPVVAYVDPSTGAFSLYDSEMATSLPAPSLPTGITRYSMSSGGRFIAYSHPTTHAIHLFDRQAPGELALPGIGVVANPGSPSVSDTGLIAFDDNGNGPARVYDGLAGTFVATGLPANNGHRQTRLSGDGSRLASTCLGGFAGSPCAVDLGGDGAVFVQNLVLGTDTAFPDDVAVAGEPSENRPCISADGSLVGFDAFAGAGPGDNVYLYSRMLGALVPVPALQTAAAERECALDADGSHVGVLNNDGDARVYDRAGDAFLALPSSLQGLSAPIVLTQPLPVRPDTRILDGPEGTLASTSATFTFDTPNAPAATFRCALDALAANPCASPRTYTGLSQGVHTFTVTATDAGLEDLSPASRTWTIAIPAPERGVPRQSRRTQLPTPSLTALDATNALIALPWAGLARQTMDKYPDRDREPRTLADASGKKNVAGVDVHWSLWLKGRSITPFADIRQPPGFSALEPSRVRLEVPRKGGWKFGWDGELAARARLKVGGETVFSWSPKVGLGLELSDIKLTADAKLNASEPERPVLDRTTLTATARIRGRGAVPVNIPVSLTARFKQHKLSLTGDFTGLKFDLGSRTAHVAGELLVEILPTQRPVTVDVDVGSYKGKAVGPNLSVGLADVRVSLKGRLRITLPRVGERSMGFKVGWRTGVIPTNEQFLDMLDLLAPPRPRSHGEGTPEPFQPAPSVGYRKVADAFESNIGDFLPWDTVLSRTWQTLDPPVLNQYAVEADSAIWTGHLLAAESYRWAASPPAEREAALERIRQLLTGMERLFRVTQDAVTVKKVTKLVPGTPTPANPNPPLRPVIEDVRSAVDPKLAGIFARVVRREGSEGKIGPALKERDCFYEWAEGGWGVYVRKLLKQKFATFRQAQAQVKKTADAAARPIAPVWHGWGCADDHPLSRDQYAGVALGLATVHQLVDDQAIRARAKAMVDKLLGNLLRHGWNVVLPPENEAPMSSSFIGQWDKQLALLLVGSKVSPEKFAAEYARYRSAAANAWLPSWASSLDPIVQYYKFNLSHAWATMLMTYETDAGARAGYQYQHDVLRRAIRHHRNAYFDLLRILLAPPGEREGVRDGDSDAFPGVTMKDQIRSTLAEYLTRRTNQDGPAGRPTNANSSAAAAFQSGLWPSRVKRFVGFDGTPACLATSALPVWARGGEHQDFMWQKDPFSLAADDGACPQRGIGGPPSIASLTSTGASPKREGPGVDYLLAYWMAVHLGVLPAGG